MMLGSVKRNFKYLTIPTFILLYNRLLGLIFIIARLFGHHIDKNSSGDEIANVNFYAVRPISYLSSLK